MASVGGTRHAKGSGPSAPPRPFPGNRGMGEEVALLQIKSRFRTCSQEGETQLYYPLG